MDRSHSLYTCTVENWLKLRGVGQNHFRGGGGGGGGGKVPPKNPGTIVERLSALSKSTRRVDTCTCNYKPGPSEKLSTLSTFLIFFVDDLPGFLSPLEAATLVAY